MCGSKQPEVKTYYLKVRSQEEEYKYLVWKYKGNIRSVEEQKGMEQSGGNLEILMAFKQTFNNCITPNFTSTSVVL